MNGKSAVPHHRIMVITITIAMPVRSRTPTIIATVTIPITSISSLVGTTVGVAVTAKNNETNSQTVHSQLQKLP